MADYQMLSELLGLPNVQVWATRSSGPSASKCSSSPAWKPRCVPIVSSSVRRSMTRLSRRCCGTWRSGIASVGCAMRPGALPVRPATGRLSNGWPGANRAWPTRCAMPSTSMNAPGRRTIAQVAQDEGLSQDTVRASLNAGQKNARPARLPACKGAVPGRNHDPQRAWSLSLGHLGPGTGPRAGCLADRSKESLEAWFEATRRSLVCAGRSRAAPTCGTPITASPKPSCRTPNGSWIAFTS